MKERKNKLNEQAKNHEDILQKIDLLIRRDSSHNTKDMISSEDKVNMLKSLSFSPLTYKLQAKRALILASESYSSNDSLIENIRWFEFNPAYFDKYTKYTSALTELIKTLSEFWTWNVLPWNSDIKDIEGRFGSGFGVYFKLLRFLIILDLATCIICFSFVVIPQLLDIIMQNGQLDFQTQVNYTNFAISDIATGEGVFQNSSLFFGGYKNGHLNIFTTNYDMTSAYYYTILLCHALALISIAVRMSIVYKRNVIDTESGRFKNQFCNNVFGGWDFAIERKRMMKSHTKIVVIQLKVSHS